MFFKFLEQTSQVFLTLTNTEIQKANIFIMSDVFLASFEKFLTMRGTW